MAKREHDIVKQQPSRVGKKSVTVYLPQNVWRELRILAATTDSTIDKLIRRGIDLVLADLRRANEQQPAR
jgi:ribosomal protein L1